MEASLYAAKVVRAKDGSRSVRVQIAADEPVSVDLLLTRNNVLLVTKGFPTSTEHKISLSAAIPPAVKKGKATLVVVLTDEAGNHKRYERTVRVPALRAQPRHALAPLAARPI